MKEEKFYCDCCGTQIPSDTHKWYFKIMPNWGSSMINRLEYRDLCEDCATKIYSFAITLKGAEP